MPLAARHPFGAGLAQASNQLAAQFTVGLPILVKLPHNKPDSAFYVLQAFSYTFNGIASPMRKSLIYDQGRQIALHK